MKNKHIDNVVLTALLLGFLTNFLWERIVSPISNIIIEKLITISNNYTTIYSSYLYKKVSTGQYGNESLYSFIFVFLFFILINIYKASKNIENGVKILQSLDSQDINKLNKVYLFIYNILKRFHFRKNTSLKKNKPTHEYVIGATLISTLSMYIIMIFSLYFMSETIFIKQKSTEILTNIEIVAPYVTDTELKKYKSSFLTIETQNDYTKLNEALSRIALKHNLQLK